MKTTRIPKKLEETIQPKTPNQSDCHKALSVPILDTFYPNECFICKTRKDLRRCRRCQMISYCGETHQKEHWEKHKEICKIIAGLLKQKGISHLYENLRGVDQKIWTDERQNACLQVEKQLSRPLLPNEVQMLRYPRVCFVCHEAKQQNLTNCPSCPSASFCSQHKNTSSHSINCFHLKFCHGLDIEFDEPKLVKVVEVAHLIVDRIFFHSENQTLPKSLKQLIIHYPKPPIEESENIKIYCSDVLTNFLTVFNALQKLQLSSVSKLLVHLVAIETHPNYSVLWEILLHLLPNLKFLKVVILNNKQILKKEWNLCNNCKWNSKHFELESSTLSYGEYLKDSSFQTPNILVSYNINPSSASEFSDELWKSFLSAWGSLSCPLVLTTRTDAKSKEIAQILKSTFPMSKFYYEALNEFASLRPKREWKLGGIFKDNQFMTILKIYHGDENEKTPGLANGIVKKEPNSVQNKIEKKLVSITKKVNKTDFDRDKIANISEFVNSKIEKNISISQCNNEKTPNLINAKIQKNSDLVLNKVEDKSKSDKVRVKSDFEQNEIDKTLESDKDQIEKTNSTSLNNKNKSSISDENLNRWDFFYVNSCQVCHTTHRVVPCNRCKMISYCGEEHRKEHWPVHKNVCKVILKMLKETEATSLFDNLKAKDTESWVAAKIDIMLKAQRNLGRKLVNYEQQMFLFPKTCFECHESDLSILKTCDCGVSLCKQHKKNLIHQDLCDNFETAFLYLLIMQKFKAKPLPTIVNQGPTKISIKSVPIQTRVKNLPSTINEFIDSCMTVSVKVAELFSGGTDIFSDLLSRPLTLLYGIQKLNLTDASSLTIHVIGATNEEFGHVGYWEILLHWLPKLKEIKVAFIGPEINGPFQIALAACESCSFVSKKPALAFSRRSRYSEYFESKCFSKPDIIVGYNLDLHESELGISECTWKESMLTLKKLYAPFILTAGTEERAKKDHMKFCDLLEKSVSHDCFESNPFASLMPERDFETEELKYANKYIVIYKGLYECLEKTDKLKTHPVEKIPVAIKDSELKMKVIAEEVKEDKKESVDDFASTIRADVVKFGDSTKQLEDAKLKEEEKKISARGLAALEEKLAAAEIKKEKESVESFEVKLNKEERKSEVFQFKEKSEVEVEESSSKLALESKLYVTTSRKEEPENKSRNTEFKSRLESKDEPSSTVFENLKPLHQDLLHDNLFFREENQQLKEENSKIKDENQTLRQENERLRFENRIIKDIRSQVDDSIRSVLSGIKF